MVSSESLLGLPHVSRPALDSSIAYAEYESRFSSVPRGLLGNSVRETVGLGTPLQELEAGDNRVLV